MKTYKNNNEGGSSLLQVNYQEPENELDTSNVECPTIQNSAILETSNLLSIDGHSYSAAPVNDMIIIDMNSISSEVLSGKFV